MVWVDHDGKEAKFGKDGFISNADDSVLWQLFNTTKRQLDKEHKKFDYKFIKSFDDFDKNVNEKQRDLVIGIFHGNESSIAIDASYSSRINIFNSDIFISNWNLEKDTQTTEESMRLKNTKLTLLSCHTWNDYFWKPIWQEIHEHYWFNTTYAPNRSMDWNWEIYDMESFIFPYKVEGHYNIFK